MLGEDIRPETIAVKFRFPDAPGVLEKVINVVAFIARGLTCINLKSVGLRGKDAAGTRSMEPSQSYPQGTKTRKGES
jgi:hypothetical protein